MKTKKNQAVALIDDEPRPRTWYQRFWRYLTLVWCWLRSVDPPPIDIPDRKIESIGPIDKIDDETFSALLPVRKRETEPKFQTHSASSPSNETEDETVDLLFVGLSRTGISTTANKLFNITKPDSMEEDDLDIIEIDNFSSNERPVDLRIIDIPGFCMGHSIEGDAELVFGIESYLKRSLPNKIPTFAFIVSSFEDARFDGESSEFSKMLLALSHCQIHWTDLQYSNVVLVLTHAGKVKEDVSKKIAIFQDVFHTIFQQKENQPVCCVVIENSIPKECNTKDFIDALLLTKNLSASKNFRRYLQKLQISEKHVPEGINIQRTNISSLLPPTKRQVYELMDTLMQGKRYENNIANDVEKNTSFKFFSHYPSYQPCNEIRRCGHAHHTTKLLPHMKLLMANGITELPVSEIRVGHKLFSGLKGNHVTVTAVEKIPSTRSRVCLHVGLYFYSNSDCDDEDDMIFKYTGRSKLQRQGIDWNTIVSKNFERLFEIEVNRGRCLRDTFIVDGYVALAAISPILKLPS